MIELRAESLAAKGSVSGAFAVMSVSHFFFFLGVCSR